MLLRVAEDPRRVVCPIIDVISMENFDYIGGMYQIRYRYWLRIRQLKYQNDCGELITYILYS